MIFLGSVWGIKFIEIVEDLISGRVTIYKVTEKSDFTSYYFKFTDAELYLKEKRIEKFISGEGILSNQLISKVFNISILKVKTFNKLGYLGNKKTPNKFTYQDLSLFNNTYITMDQLQQYFQINSIKRIIVILEEKNIKSITNENEIFIFLKEDIQKKYCDFPTIDIKDSLIKI